MAPKCFRGGKGGGSGRGGGFSTKTVICKTVTYTHDKSLGARQYNKDDHFATLWHQTNGENRRKICKEESLKPSRDGWIYASPTPEATFDYATNRGVLLKLSVRCCHLEDVGPGKVRFRPYKDYNIEAFAEVGPTKQWLSVADWNHVHIEVNH
ncbi:unnamed protein product [Vitrella brassicaformis CCMP3155]|uniref:Uncharacterized protein n=1 Tax=Vitrella brassicaformis (strain CCMP3155) TaxID=1169540 RepID=A0A0G4ELB1_VITBC|nr:unnamed protein product [Vitrella brassicaformis CCMP3155]|eukprot:CEL97966.1 unnamed protein product [Vitrella brassicaformis CCMP3155]